MTLATCAVKNGVLSPLDVASTCTIMPYNGHVTAGPIREAWDNLLKCGCGVNALYQSPQWFEHIATVESPETRDLARAAQWGGRGMLPRSN